MMLRSVASAWGVDSRAAAFTSETIRLASIVSGLFGLPPGLGHVPGRQLVDRLPPLGILVCLKVACSLPVL
jgi:hypothetical protein